MKLYKRYLKAILIVLISLLTIINCRTGEENMYIRSVIPAGSQIAVLIEGENDLKNAVFTEFLKAGYRVKAMNANDFYTLDDVFETKDLKKSALIGNVDEDEDAEVNAVTLDKMFDNIYKLHVYNFENTKADILQQIRMKYSVDYLLLIQMKEWRNGYSWARAIKLDSMDLWYVHNYPNGRGDSVQDIVRRVISAISKGRV